MKNSQAHSKTRQRLLALLAAQAVLFGVGQTVEVQAAEGQAPNEDSATVQTLVNEESPVEASTDDSQSVDEVLVPEQASANAQEVPSEQVDPADDPANWGPQGTAEEQGFKVGEPGFVYQEPSLTIKQIGRYESGAPFDEAGTEIAVYNPDNDYIYSVNGYETSLDVIDTNAFQDNSFDRVNRVKLADHGIHAGDVTSVALHPSNQYIAVAAQAEVKTDPGYVVFFDKAGTYQNHVQLGPNASHIGALPDNVQFTNEGHKLLVAIEGEPSEDYNPETGQGLNPPGGLVVIDTPQRVEDLLSVSEANVRFVPLTEDHLALDPNIRTVGQSPEEHVLNLEPEFVVVDSKDQYAYVAIQEANTLAKFDIETEEFVDMGFLGYKDHSVKGNELDPSDRDDLLQPRKAPVLALHQPDAIAYYEVNGHPYILIPGEGDGVDYDGGYSDETRVKDLAKAGKIKLNADHYQGYTQEELDSLDNLFADEELGRLRVTTDHPFIDADGNHEALVAYGSRSFAVVDGETLEIVWDSGADFENIILARNPEFFNVDVDGERNEFRTDKRSDNKGPEPETIVVGEVDGIPYAFIALERTLGFMAYDISDIKHPVFADFYYDDTWTDISPEGLQFIPADQSPTGKALLLAAYEQSGTIGVYELEAQAIDTWEASNPQGFNYQDQTNEELLADDTFQEEGSRFSIVVLPDTQFYSRYSTEETGNQFNELYGSEPFAAQTQWIVDNQENFDIQMVLHVGDVVDRANRPEEWQVADEAMKILEDGDVNYAVVAGNHDIGGQSGYYGNYLNTFSPERAALNETLVERDPHTGANEFHLFEADGQSFAVLGLSWGSAQDPAVFQWAQDQLDAHADTPTILVSHQLININPDNRQATPTDFGEAVWDDLINQNNQVFLTFNGHHHGSTHVERENAYGKPVHQVLTDHQMAYMGGNGYMVLVEFDLSHDKIHFTTFSPWVLQKDPDLLVADDQALLRGNNESFTIDFDFSSRLSQTLADGEATDSSKTYELRQGIIENFQEPTVPELVPAENEDDYPRVEGTVAHWRIPLDQVGQVVPVAGEIKDLTNPANSFYRAELNIEGIGGAELDDVTITADAHPLSANQASIRFTGGSRNNTTGLPYKTASWFNTLADAPINTEEFENGYTFETFVKFDPDFNEEDNRWMQWLVREGERGNIENYDGSEPDEPPFAWAMSNLREVQFAYTDSQDQPQEGSNWSGEIVNLDDWYHLAAVNDPETQTLVLYVNGVPVLRNSVDTVGMAHDNGKPWSLGAGQYDSEREAGFIGWVGETRLVDRPLDQSEWLTARAPQEDDDDSLETQVTDQTDDLDDDQVTPGTGQTDDSDDSDDAPGAGQTDDRDDADGVPGAGQTDDRDDADDVPGAGQTDDSDDSDDTPGAGQSVDTPGTGQTDDSDDSDDAPGAGQTEDRDDSEVRLVRQDSSPAGSQRYEQGDYRVDVPDSDDNSDIDHISIRKVDWDDVDQANLAARYSDRTMDLYEIHAVDADGQEVPVPAGVTVTLPIEDDRTVEAVIHFGNAFEIQENLAFTVGDDSVTFQAPGFSYFGVLYADAGQPVRSSRDSGTSKADADQAGPVQTAGKESAEDQTSNEASLPQTGASSLLGVASGSILAGLGLVGVKRRRN